jgi:hypothetical protein
MMNLKGCGRKRSWPNIKALSQNLAEETEEKKNTKNLRIGGFGTRFEPGTSRIRNSSVKPLDHDVRWTRFLQILSYFSVVLYLPI